MILVLKLKRYGKLMSKYILISSNMGVHKRRIKGGRIKGGRIKGGRMKGGRMKGGRIKGGRI